MPRCGRRWRPSIDRVALNQVVFEGAFLPSNQAQAPGTAFYNAERPVPPRDLAKARRLLAEAGMPKPAFTLLTVNSPVEQQVAEVIQAMAAEAGFEIRVQTLEAGRDDRADRPRRLRGGDRHLVRPRRPGCQCQHLAAERRLPELGQIRQPGIRRAAGPGAAAAPTPRRGRRCIARPARSTSPKGRTCFCTTTGCSGG